VETASAGRGTVLRPRFGTTAAAVRRVPDLELTEARRTVLAEATRWGKLVPTQAHRWAYPNVKAGEAGLRVVRNKLGELVRAGLLVRVPVRYGVESVYIPTAKGARVVRELTGGLAAPPVPDPKDTRWLATLGHDLTVAEAAHWLLARKGARGARFLTERQLVRARILARPPAERRGAAGFGPRPDGELLLSTEERLAVEVELHDKAARLGEKLAWYRDAAGYDEVLWLVPGAGVEEPLWAAVEAAGCAALMAVETLPPECLAYVG
jgi:hypothetical protein